MADQRRVRPTLSGNQTVLRQYAIRSMIAVAVIMIIIFGVGLRAYIMAIDLDAGAFWPAIPMILATVFAYTGLKMQLLGRSLLIACLIFLSIAVCLCIVATISDGLTAQYIHHTNFLNCFYDGVEEFIPSCVSNDSRSYNRYPSRTCACCYLYRDSYVSKRWHGVDSCEEIHVTLQGFLWTSVALNIIGVVACIVALSAVGGYVSLMRSSIGGPSLPVQYGVAGGQLVLGTPPGKVGAAVQNQPQAQVPPPYVTSDQVAPTASTGRAPVEGCSRPRGIGQNTSNVFRSLRENAHVETNSIVESSQDTSPLFVESTDFHLM